MYKLVKRKRKIKKNRQLILERKLLRLSIFKSNKHIYLQLIYPNKEATIVLTASSVESYFKNNKFFHNKKKKFMSYQVGLLFAMRYKSKPDIGKFVFDRSGFKFHGRVKEVVMALRDSGLIF